VAETVGSFGPNSLSHASDSPFGNAFSWSLPIFPAVVRNRNPARAPPWNKDAILGGEGRKIFLIGGFLPFQAVRAR
jgi:hypothetical protein